MKKYKVDNVENYKGTKGWICGQFFPDNAIQKNDKLEVKYSTIMPGYSHLLHYHPNGVEVSLIINGKLRYLVDGKEYLLSAGDFVFMYEDIKEAILEVFEPTTIVSIRTPSIPNNKVYS